MKIVKYDKKSDKSSNITSGGSSGGSTSVILSGSPLNRVIWGKLDDGEDIDGTMIVNGDITVKSILPTEYEEDDVVSEEGGGNLSVELKITSNEVESEDIYATRHLFINYPEHSVDDKKCVGELIKDIENNVKTNSDEIERLKKSVNEDLKDLDVTNSIKTLLEELRVLKYGNYQHPIILIAGLIKKNNYTDASYNYTFEGCKSDLIKNLEINVDGGTLIITPTYEDRVVEYINAIHITLELSGDTADNTTATKSFHKSNTSISSRNDGAHWFEAYYEDNKFKIREFHLGNGDNDTWINDNWAGTGGGIRSINITVIGYLYKVN